MRSLTASRRDRSAGLFLRSWSSARITAEAPKRPTAQLLLTSIRYLVAPSHCLRPHG
ncbi:hypothetical protein RE6C_04014 [Rhodopirellula europaea 6C]|uniref:Uncharacterized protein n=1 Tax=Rhodopirellula europaea 6C TaxID=1263867 RepID=M2AR79_9BACT|nr:hypothetical protein RE6C_04014 [Rhodopirellula europaea 6C]